MVYVFVAVVEVRAINAGFGHAPESGARLHSDGPRWPLFYDHDWSFGAYCNGTVGH